ncbi:hypothetical protein ACJX0J_021264, partial [Zea mays]
MVLKRSLEQMVTTLTDVIVFKRMRTSSILQVQRVQVLKLQDLPPVQVLLRSACSCGTCYLRNMTTTRIVLGSSSARCVRQGSSSSAHPWRTSSSSPAIRPGMPSQNGLANSPPSKLLENFSEVDMMKMIVLMPTQMMLMYL